MKAKNKKRAVGSRQSGVGKRRNTRKPRRRKNNLLTDLTTASGQGNLLGKAITAARRRRKRRAVGGKRTNGEAQAATAFEKAHWGIRATKKKTAEIDVPPALAVMGKLVSVVYRTAKGDEGEGEYEHEFSEPLPDLSFSPDGKQLFITGGRFKVRPEGIVN